jgi:hypothetical protein
MVFIDFYDIQIELLLLSKVFKCSSIHIENIDIKMDT